MPKKSAPRTKKKDKPIPPPEVVQIGYVDYKIIGISSDEAEKLGVNGHFLKEKQEIHYDETLNRTALTNVIIHECIHAIIDMHDLKFKNDDEEEKVVTSISNGMTALFRANPQLLKFIVENLK